MDDGTTDTMRVRFPANPDYGRIGRVAVAGLALRLGVDVQRVENLRLAVDAAVAALQGPGDIEIDIRWSPGELALTVDNAAVTVDPGLSTALGETLEPLVDQHSLSGQGITLRLESLEG